MVKLLFFDCETTGLYPGKHGIHQISGAIVIDGVEKELFDFKVQPNPKCIIEQAALDVAGVTKEQIMAYPVMIEVYFSLTKMLAKYVDKFKKDDKFFLVGYNNAAFDNQFFRGFFLQNGDQYFGSWFWSNTLDVMVLASEYLMEQRPGMVDFKLATVAKELGINVDESKLHDASFDIALTRAIYTIVTNGN